MKSGRNFRLLTFLASLPYLGLSVAQLPSTDDSLDIFTEKYTQTVRKNLASFHKNLSRGKYSENGILESPDIQWNYDGTMVLSRAAATQTLKAVVEGSFSGLYAPDIYHIVEGNKGAILYGLVGNQTGPFAGQPVRQGARFNVRGGELMVFDSDALLWEVITVEPIQKMVKQMAGVIDVPVEAPGSSPDSNPQTTVSYRAKLRGAIRQLHINANSGNHSENAILAIENVFVDDNGNTGQGREAFVALASAKHVGMGAFAVKAFHDDHVVVDGRLGAVEYAWQGTQSGPYMSIQPKGAIVRMRGMLFFEFNAAGLITKAIGVHDEGVILTQLENKGSYMYP
jgi:hypothetical protein